MPSASTNPSRFPGSPTQTVPGHKRWYIADAYLPSSGIGQTWEGHESICVLNPGQGDAHLTLNLLFEDRPPTENIQTTVKARTCRHIGMHKPEQLADTQVPRDVPYGIELLSDNPVIVQYSRLDVTQPNFSLMTTTPYAAD